MCQTPIYQLTGWRRILLFQLVKGSTLSGENPSISFTASFLFSICVAMPLPLNYSFHHKLINMIKDDTIKSVCSTFIILFATNILFYNVIRANNYHSLISNILSVLIIIVQQQSQSYQLSSQYSHSRSCSHSISNRIGRSSSNRQERWAQPRQLGLQIKHRPIS